MAMTSAAPADTTMMRIVHDALRRDLARARATMAEPGRAGQAQRRAAGAHLSWMMRFVRAHHASERPPRRVQMENSVAVNVDAEVDEVWAVVRDVTRVGEWSHECVGAAWVGESASATPGARFRGRNRAGVFRWGRLCEIASAEPYELVWRTVPTRLYPDSSEWRISLEKIDGGTTISQHFRVLRAPKVLSVLYALVIPAHRDRTAALIDDLKRLGEAARGSRTPA